MAIAICVYIFLCSWLWADEHRVCVCASIRYLIVDIELFISNGSRICSTQYLVISVFLLAAAEPKPSEWGSEWVFAAAFFLCIHVFSVVRGSRDTCKSRGQTVKYDWQWGKKVISQSSEHLNSRLLLKSVIMAQSNHSLVVQPSNSTTLLQSNTCW